MKVKTIKHWFWVHRWTSLICTLFLLLLCITGLPIVFTDEIHDWQMPEKPYPYAKLPANTPNVSLDSLRAVALRLYPNDIIENVTLDDDEPKVTISMDSQDEKVKDGDHSLQFDRRTAMIIRDSRKDKEVQVHSTPIVQILNKMYTLHVSIFMGLPGELFLALMALLFVFSVASGILLYGPFMKKLDFGTIRKEQSKRLKWLDLHNVLGIVIAAWMLVVGFTGLMNELSTPLFGLFQMKESARQLKPYRGKPIPSFNELSSLQGVLDTAQNALPAMEITAISYPTKRISPWHYLIWSKGKTPATSRLYYPIVIDARTGHLTAVLKMPWYLRTLEVSRPLHFGDYGGIPLKIIWALFDLITIVVLMSGIYLWLARRKAYRNFFEKNEVNDEIQ